MLKSAGEFIGGQVKTLIGCILVCIPIAAYLVYLREKGELREALIGFGIALLIMACFLGGIYLIVID